MEKAKGDKAEKIKRHLDNLRLFSGYFHGMFFLLGVRQPNLGSAGKLKEKYKATNGKQVKR